MSKLKPTGAGSFAAAQATLRDDGQPPESQWPYDGLADESTLQKPVTVIGPFSTAAVNIRQDPTDGQLLSALKNGFLPVIGLVTTPAFMASNGNILARREKHLGRHAVLLVGIARYDGPSVAGVANGDLVFCIRNSWGTGWGHNGYGYIASSVWDDIVEVAAVVT